MFCPRRFSPLGPGYTLVMKIIFAIIFLGIPFWLLSLGTVLGVILAIPAFIVLFPLGLIALFSKQSWR